MLRHRSTLSCALALCLIFATAAQAFPATPRAVVPFFAENASNEAILSEMALHPAAVRRGSVTYMAYQGPGYDPFVVSYDEATGAWNGPHRVGTNPLILDAHGAPALFFDAAGRLHVLYGGHGLRLFHARATGPGVLDSWEDLPYIDTYGTYPQVMDAPDGRVLLFYRSLGHDWVVRESDTAREIFGEAVTVLQAAADTWWYADFRPGTDGNVHAAFVWVDNVARASGSTLGRRNAYYMRRDVSGEWYTATGTPVPIPVTRKIADESLRIYDSQGAGTNEISVKEDSTGAPCVLFITGSGAGKDAYTWTFARSSEDTWTFTPITTADHTFDSGAILPGEDGFVEALLVAGYSGAVGTTDLDPRGRGGAIERWTSSDYGMTWERDARITPDENGTAFADPQFVLDGEGSARAVFVEWVTDPSNFFNRMFLWGDDGLVSREVTTTVSRLAGPARAQTAVEISKLGFPEGAKTIVLATEKDFPDALAGVPLAHRLNAPLLLTATDTLSTGVAEEIARLGATSAVLLGGTNALSASIESELLARTRVTTIERVSGETRYDTALEISRRMHDPTDGVKIAVLVSGQNWPDAATAAPLAAVMGAPILLTRSDMLMPQAAQALVEWGTSKTLVVGGTSVISPAVENAVPFPTRLAGATRYETAAAVAEAGLELNYLPYRVLVATGLKFPDALAGAALASRLRAPVLLTHPDVLPDAALGYFDAHHSTITRSFIIGNTGAVSAGVEKVIGKQSGD